MAPTPLYNYVKKVITSTWSASCVKFDNNTNFVASNGHLNIRFQHSEGSTPFLSIRAIQRSSNQTSGFIDLFNGYVRSNTDFDLILELTSVQNPDW